MISLPITKSIGFNKEQKKALLYEFFRFGVSGGLAAASGMLTVYVLVDFFHLWYLASSITAFFITFVVAFVLQKFWTFKNYTMAPLPKQAAFGFGVAALNFFLNTALMYGFVGRLHLNYLLAQFLTYGFFGVVDFCIYKFIIFRG